MLRKEEKILVAELSTGTSAFFLWCDKVTNEPGIVREGDLEKEDGILQRKIRWDCFFSFSNTDFLYRKPDGERKIIRTLAEKSKKSLLLEIRIFK